MAIVTDAWQLLVCRAGMGLAVSATVPIINSLVRHLTKESERGGIYGIFQSGYLIGNMIGPLAGGGLAAFMGMRAIFFATAGFLCLGALMEENEDAGQTPRAGTESSAEILTAVSA